MATSAHWQESPRWLHANGKSGEAARVLQELAISNGVECGARPQLKSAATSPAAAAAASTHHTPSAHTKLGVAVLFSSPSLRGRSVGMVYCWFAASFAYYGLSLNAGNLGGSLLFNFGLGVSEVVLASICDAICRCESAKSVGPLCCCCC